MGKPNEIYKVLGHERTRNRRGHIVIATLAVCVLIISCTGKLRVSSSPSGATVFTRKVDGTDAAAGRTPFSGSAFSVEAVKVRWNDGVESEEIKTAPNLLWISDRYAHFAKNEYLKSNVDVSVLANPRGKGPNEKFSSKNELSNSPLPRKESAPHVAASSGTPTIKPKEMPSDETDNPPRKTSHASVPGVSWAVITGVSIYSDSRIPRLRYASTDARAFYYWLVSPEGGQYAPSRVRLLLDKDATSRSIREAFFEWLKQPIEEDKVTIFFAGHGSPESPESAENLYLLPYDVEYDKIASTAFPMWDIETALKRYIKAKRVIVIADACHSGGVGSSFDAARRAGRGIKVIAVSLGLQQLTTVSEGICVISASDENQMSQEGKQWGGGHGVFTYFMLKGLMGEADTSRNGEVSLGELTLYLSQEVRRATMNAQSPTVAGKFDPAMSIGR